MALMIKSVILSPNDGDYRIVSRFIGDLVRDAIASENSDYFDTLLLRMEKKSTSDFYGEIASEASITSTMTIDCFLTRKIKIQQHFSMIIVVTDENNGVRID